MQPFLVVGLALAVFATDTLLPLGIAGGVPYVACVLLAMGRERLVLLTVILASLFTVLGYFLSPDGAAPYIVWINRALALMAIWTVALLVLQRGRAEARLRASLVQKEVLLRELHHRVKNNLQVISSILNLQLTGAENDATTTALMESRTRIQAIARLHETLHRADDLSAVNLAVYLPDLIENLSQTIGEPERIEVLCRADSVRMGIDSGVSCGLLVNELVTNALKHGFPDGATGSVLVELQAVRDGLCRLRVSDDGVGMASEPTHRGLGLQLVEALSMEFGGQGTWKSEDGTRFEVLLEC